jgi:hypothetical protein
MAGNVSLPSDCVPSLLLECVFRDGTINAMMYMKYQEKIQEDQKERTK